MLPDLDTYFAAKRALINQALDQYLPSATTRPAILHEAMRYSVLAESKRLRPIMTLAAAEAVGGSEANAILPAVSLEILHTYTLVHDDLPAIDNDDIRRGQPSSHIKYGEANAIFVGDALLTLVFELLAKTNNPHLITELAQAAGSQGVVGGQVEDLLGQDKAWIDEKKTAGLFAAAIRLGAISGGATTAQLKRLTDYALHFGFAFQAIDDILDHEADESTHERAQTETKAALAALKDCPCQTETLEAIAKYSLNRINTEVHD